MRPQNGVEFRTLQLNFEHPPMLLLRALFISLLWFRAVAFLPAAEPTKPNIVVILADD